MEKEIIKRFHEENSDTFHDTLKSAKQTMKYPYIQRVWLSDGQIIGKSLMCAYGEQFSSIKSADEIIAKQLSKEGIK